MWRNDIKCKCMLMFILKKLARKGLIFSSTNFTHIFFSFVVARVKGQPTLLLDVVHCCTVLQILGDVQETLQLVLDFGILPDKQEKANHICFVVALTNICYPIVNFLCSASPPFTIRGYPAKRALSVMRKHGG